MGVLNSYVFFSVFFRKAAEDKPIKERTDLESWLTFLTAVDPEEICALIEAFPMYKAMYNRLYRSIG